MFSLNSFSRSYSEIFCFEVCIEARVLDGDADVAGQRLEQLHVFARKKVAIGGASEPDHRDSAVLHATRQVVVQIEQSCGMSLRFRQMQRLLRVLEKDV